MKVGIFGSAEEPIEQELKQKCLAIGREIARRNHSIVTGGCGGVPYAAVIGAAEQGGETIGYSPALDLKEHIITFDYPYERYTKLIFIPEEYGNLGRMRRHLHRNILSVASADAAIFIGGRISSMNEFTIALTLGKNIGVLENSGGITEKAIKRLLKDGHKDFGYKVVFNSDPISLLNEPLTDKMSENKFRLRPRHLVRLDMYIRAVELGIPNPGYVMGYNECMRKEEINIFEKIRESMKECPSLLIVEITDSLEDICGLCPKNNDPSCNDQTAKLHDRVIAEVYQAEIGARYTPGELAGLLHRYHKNALEMYHK